MLIARGRLWKYALGEVPVTLRRRRAGVARMDGLHRLSTLVLRYYVLGNRLSINYEELNRLEGSLYAVGLRRYYLMVTEIYKDRGTEHLYNCA